MTTSSETEKVTLHFNFSNLDPDTELTFVDGSEQVPLKAHTPETRLFFQKKNRLLGLLNDTQLNQFSHFVETAEFPTTEVSTCFITYPSKRKGAVAGALAGIYTHKPVSAVKRAVEGLLMGPGDSSPTLPGRFKQYGIETLHSDHSNDLLQSTGNVFADAGYTVNYKDIAIKLIMQHPDIASVIPEAYVRMEELILNDPNFSKFARYIKEHNTDDDDCWYENTVSKDLNGNILEPSNELTDRKDALIVWPTMEVTNKDGDTEIISVVPQYKLTDGVAKAIRPVLISVLQQIQDNPVFKGDNWMTQNGTTSHSRTGDDQSLFKSANLRNDASKAWSVTASTTEHGIDFYYDTVKFDPDSKRLSFEVKNWANRWLGVYCQFLDAEGNAIDNPSNWESQSSKLGHFEPSKSKKFLETLGPGSVIFGAPVAACTQRTSLSFKVPDNAASVKILFGGLGSGERDNDVDQLGIIYTSLLSYALPGVLALMSVGMNGNKEYLDFFDKKENMAVVCMLALVCYAPLFQEGSKSMGTNAVLLKTADFAAGFLFSYGMKSAALYITKKATYQQILQNQPGVGWILRIAGIASAIGSMISTTVSCEKSPSTFVFKAERMMDLEVTVKPDPSHGTSTQAPIWPEAGVKYKMVVIYDGVNKTLVKEGLLPAKNDDPLKVVFSRATNDALFIIPDKKFQVACAIFTKNDSLVGIWSSDWRNLQPGKDNKIVEEGAIREMLVPLVSSTKYEHKKKLAYKAATRKYVWEQGPAPTDTHGKLKDQDVSELVGITINNLAYKLGYTYQAKNQNLPIDLGNTPSNTHMYVMKNISTLNDPSAGMKVSGFGMSVQPSLAYDQFGPAGLLELDATDAELHNLNSGKISAAMRTSFTAKSIPLSAGALVSTITKDVSWKITEPGNTNPLYVLRRQVDVIKVFAWPTPEFSPNNFFLDTRTYAAQGKFHLRLVNLNDNASANTFGKDSPKSWGTFHFKVTDMVIHPAGYAIGINYDNHLMAILKLETEGVDDDKAPAAAPFGGPGWREGLLKGPVAMTVTADGRVLILESQNARVQSFDTSGNPVPCFKTNLAFHIPETLANDLKTKTYSRGFWEQIQKSIPVLNFEIRERQQRYLNMPKVNLDISFIKELNTKVVSDALRKEFSNRGITLSPEVSLSVTRENELWLLHDEKIGLWYDIRYGTEGRRELNVYAGMALTVSEKAAGSHWVINDNSHALCFDVVSNNGRLDFTRLSSVMLLKTNHPKITYLDVACEMKGYIYVLSYKDSGNSAADYQLDIYNPDGSPLTGVGNNGTPAAARLTVDQWRNMFTLNYERLEGMDGHPEPSVSVWIPNA